MRVITILRPRDYINDYQYSSENIAATPPFRPTHLASSYLGAAQVHQEEVNRTLQSLRYQYEAIRIASSSLDLHVLAIQEAFEAITVTAERELQKQKTLLAGLDADLEIVQEVNVHKEFVSPSVRKAMEAGDRGRTLGDYVSQGKMRQVAETCRRTHRKYAATRLIVKLRGLPEELEDRTSHVQGLMTRLKEGTDSIRALTSDTRSVGCHPLAFRS